LEQNRERIRAQGLGLAAISYDSVAVLKSFADRQHIGFPLLSDPDSKVIRSYGILNETIDRHTPFYGIPNPGTYVLNERGVVVAKYFEDDYRVRDTAESILLRQFGVMGANAGEGIAGKHIRIVVSGGDAAVRPNQRVTLAVEGQLAPRVHVYAPGVSGYIPVSLKLAPSAGFQAEPVVFPAAKTMRLEAIHETVPVYEGQFRLMETITLEGPKELEPLLDARRNLTIEGEFRYQACDDKECFVPETLRLKWTIPVLPFDRTRAPEPLQRNM
jgi:hypothetical protein